MGARGGRVQGGVLMRMRMRDTAAGNPGAKAARLAQLGWSSEIGGGEVGLERVEVGVGLLVRCGVWVEVKVVAT